MSIWFQPTKATIWKVENKGKYSDVRLSTGRTVQNTEPVEWVNSSWSFVRFVGQAHDAVQGLAEKTRVILESGNFSLEPYKKEGSDEWLYPKSPRLVVFKISFPESSGGGGGMDTPPKVKTVESDDSEDLPF
jgi:hypothetical protein